MDAQPNRNTTPFKKPEECSFDSLNIAKPCFWKRNWYLVLSGLVVPIITIKIFCFSPKDVLADDDDRYYEADSYNTQCKTCPGTADP